MTSAPPRGIDGKQMDPVAAKKVARASGAGRGTRTKRVPGGTSAGEAVVEWLHVDLLRSMAAIGRDSERAAPIVDAAARIAQSARRRWLRQLDGMGRGSCCPLWTEALERQASLIDSGAGLLGALTAAGQLVTAGAIARMVDGQTAVLRGLSKSLKARGMQDCQKDMAVSRARGADAGRAGRASSPDIAAAGRRKQQGRGSTTSNCETGGGARWSGGKRGVKWSAVEACSLRVLSGWSLSNKAKHREWRAMQGHPPQVATNGWAALTAEDRRASACGLAVASQKVARWVQEAGLSFLFSPL